ncbi:hypothetical protein HM1_0501 [Heliomicrobium modesticaldum Ice1]|uniref:Uncharacterized protein n=2 Tax=Heliomicrobium modesticaldum TaxID=35701 RepID=B0TFL6_HELMI|nr:hypothetical protein HM1_0501 [Heliomicrobium modesticaldum Ice1]
MDALEDLPEESPEGLPEESSEILPKELSEPQSRFTRLDHMAVTEEANNLGDDLLIDNQPAVDKPSDPGLRPSQQPR